MEKYTMSNKKLTKVINDFIPIYIKDNKKINSPYDINNGWCIDFASDVVRYLGGETDKLYIVCSYNFMIGEDGVPEENDIWDADMLKNYWKKVNPTNNLTWKDINCIDFGYHEWIYFDGKHYDAECPEGVDNFFYLPLFQKYITEYINKK